MDFLQKIYLFWCFLTPLTEKRPKTYLNEKVGRSVGLGSSKCTGGVRRFFWGGPPLVGGLFYGSAAFNQRAKLRSFKRALVAPSWL
jgi:hypothetical protein